MQALRANVIGWHDHRNTGDDAMLAVIAWALREWRGVDQIRVLVRPGNLPSLGVPGVRIRAMVPPWIGAWDWAARAARRRLSRDGAVLLLGGGSILHSEHSIAWKAAVLRRFRAGGGGSAGALGVSLGPFPGAEAERACASLLRSLDFLVVRDRASWEFASAQELPYPPVLAPDLSVLLPRVRARPVDAGGATAGRLGISFKASGGDGALGERRLQVLAGAVREVVSAGRFTEVALLEFCGDRRHGDGAALEALRRALGPAVPTVYVGYRRDPLDMLAAVSNCEGLLAMRLHSQVFAALAGVPFVGIGYHRKSSDVLDTLGAGAGLLREKEIPIGLLAGRLMALGARQAGLGQALEKARAALARVLGPGSRD